METKKPLMGKNLAQLEQLAKELALPKFVGKQMADWLYKKEIASIDDMSNLSKEAREKLSQHHTLGLSAPVKEEIAKDGTKKYLFQTASGQYIESVFIPDKERATLCVSSQVGCKMNCGFCMTGRMGFSNNLTSAEILNQVFSVPERHLLTNIVFMGMGEPMDNIDAVLEATHAITEEWGMAWSPKRITVSTIGIEKGMKRFLNESKCHLAISLHNPFSDQREELMPIERAFKLDRLMTTLREYDFSGQRRLSFEYTMFKGWNDTPAHARKLVELARSIECRVNLIRFHAVPGFHLESSDPKTMIQFRDHLNHHGILATIRASRGEDILAACGMLSTKQQQKKSEQPAG